MKIIKNFMIFAGLFYLLLPPALAAKVESVFEKANAYTVKVSTRVETPFFDSKKGSFMGTGFVVDKERGWILTNAHVASRSPSVVHISFKGAEEIAAKKLYVDPLIDVAVLQVDRKLIPSHIKTAPLDCKQKPKAGHPVGVFGHPWGFDYTATRGIVSGYTFMADQHLMQIDAPVNHGNSGGPLISIENGEVVGIATAMLNNSRAKRMNFAEPIVYACKIIALLRAGKNPSPPDFPVTFFEDRNKGHPLKVAWTNSNQTAFPLIPNDEIIRLGKSKEHITHSATLSHLLRGNYQKPVAITLKRNGHEQDIKLSVSPMKKITDYQGVYVSGLIISDIAFPDGKAMNLEDTLMVHDVKSGTIAMSKEIEEIDILVSVDGESYSDTTTLYDALTNMANRKRKAHFIFKRMGGEGRNLFNHYEYDLPVTDLKLIGSQDK